MHDFPTTSRCAQRSDQPSQRAEQARRAKPSHSRAVAAVAALAVTALTVGAAHAADPVNSINSYTADPGAVLGGKLISWQGEVLANRNLNGFTAFSAAGVASPSPINAGAPVKTMGLFSGLLAWIDTANNVKTSNPGGTVANLGPVNATANALLGVGTQLWVARAGGIDRYAPSGSLGGASTITLAAGAVVEMAIGPDANIWVVEKNGGVDMLTKWSPIGAPVGAAFNFANSGADPVAIAAGPDNAVWVVLGGTNSVARFDAGGSYAEFALPGGAVPTGIAAGSDGMWLVENGLNNVSKLTFAGGVFTRTAYAAPSAFGLKGIIIGPDANVWTVGTNVNRMGRFGTVSPTTTATTSTTIAAATTTSTTTLPPAPTLPPTTAKPFTQPVATKAPAKKKVCTKYVKRRVKVKGKYVTRSVCSRYKLV